MKLELSYVCVKFQTLMIEISEILFSFAWNNKFIVGPKTSKINYWHPLVPIGYIAKNLTSVNNRTGTKQNEFQVQCTALSLFSLNYYRQNSILWLVGFLPFPHTLLNGLSFSCYVILFFINFSLYGLVGGNGWRAGGLRVDDLGSAGEKVLKGIRHRELCRPIICIFGHVLCPCGDEQVMNWWADQRLKVSHVLCIQALYQ